MLIREGAKLVDTAADVVEALASSPLVELAPGDTGAVVAAAVSERTPADDVDAPLLAVLGHDPIDPDALLAASGMAPAALNARLLMLELAGRVERLPGGRWQRLVR